MAETTLPEQMILLILSWLPVKSLIRFTCVSKRFHSIILSDPKFAKSQLQAARNRKTVTQRLLYSPTIPEIESLDLDSPSFKHRSSVRKHKLPSAPAHEDVLPLGSCNGIVFLAFDDKVLYAWNPSTGFFKKLPDPGFSTKKTELSVSDPGFYQKKNEFSVYGVGYLPATDDYRVFIVSTDYEEDDKKEVALFSTKAKAWKTVQVDFSVFCFKTLQGIHVREALHWLDTKKGIVAFDLGQEEEHKFREMSLPRNFNDGRGGYYENHLGVAAGGKLCIAHNLCVCGDSVAIWVMGEYGVLDSWTKRFNLKFSCPPRQDYNYNSVLVLETWMVAELFVHKRYEIGRGLVKIGQKEEDTCSIYKAQGDWLNMIQYQESLLQIED